MLRQHFENTPLDLSLQFVGIGQVAWDDNQHVVEHSSCLYSNALGCIRKSDNEQEMFGDRVPCDVGISVYKAMDVG